MSKMTPEKFDGIVKARANERVQQAIMTAKKAVVIALSPLMGKQIAEHHLIRSYSLKNEIHAVKDILKVLASDNHAKGWPSEIWRRAEAEVESELLNIMDEMQKAMLAAQRKPNDDDCMAAEEETQ